MPKMGFTGVRITDTGPLNLQRKLMAEWKVGIQPEDYDQKHGGKGADDYDGRTVGEVAAVNEFGMGTRFPSRPALRRWADKGRREHLRHLERVARKAIRRQVFQQSAGVLVAQHFERSMKAFITGGAPVKKNAPRTLWKKRPETRPLINTGHFVETLRGTFRGWSKRP